MDKIIQQRLENKSTPIPGSGCQIWLGAVNKEGGYGIINIKGRLYYAHRLSYEIFINPIPQKMNILHKCDIPSCINPHHLFLGTQKENVLDAVRKGRKRNGNEKKTHCPQGHLYSINNTYRWKTMRFCKNCHKLAQKKYWAQMESYHKNKERISEYVED